MLEIQICIKGTNSYFKIQNSFFFIVMIFYWTFEQINAALVKIRDCIETFLIGSAYLTVTFWRCIWEWIKSRLIDEINRNQIKDWEKSDSPGIGVLFRGVTLNPLIGYWSGVLAGARIRTSFSFPVLRDTCHIKKKVNSVYCMTEFVPHRRDQRN